MGHPAHEHPGAHRDVRFHVAFDQRVPGLTLNRRDLLDPVQLAGVRLNCRAASLLCGFLAGGCHGPCKSHGWRKPTQARRRHQSERPAFVSARASGRGPAGIRSARKAVTTRRPRRADRLLLSDRGHERAPSRTRASLNAGLLSRIGRVDGPVRVGAWTEVTARPGTRRPAGGSATRRRGSVNALAVERQHSRWSERKWSSSRSPRRARSRGRRRQV